MGAMGSKEPDEYLLVESTKAQDELGLVRTTAPFFLPRGSGA